MWPPLSFPTNHVRAYHVTLSCGLHGAADVYAGEQKVKKNDKPKHSFVLIGWQMLQSNQKNPNPPTPSTQKN